MLAASAAAGRTLPLLPATGAAPALPKKGGILRYDLSIDRPHLDPHVDSGDAFSLVKGTIYSLMVRLNEKMEIVPDLAESWERPDNLTCVFRLRKNVKWHDESNFTSADVKASTEQILDPKIGAWAGGDLKNVQRVETPDDETVRFILRPPDAAFLPTLTFANSLIASKALIERGADLRNQIIGTGPFKVAARHRRYGLYWALYPGNIRRAEVLRFLQGLSCHLPQGFTLIWDRHRPHRPHGSRPGWRGARGSSSNGSQPARRTSTLRSTSGPIRSTGTWPTSP
jgi:ABC-type oligopeptide transport system substrate-binding subunit